MRLHLRSGSDPCSSRQEQPGSNNARFVERVPGKVSGVWLFKGTRVPVKALFENLEDGAGVDDFLRWFPGVKREHVLAVLEFAEQSLTVA